MWLELLQKKKKRGEGEKQFLPQNDFKRQKENGVLLSTLKDYTHDINKSDYLLKLLFYESRPENCSNN